jgi:tetratricopeptide (TPR) repeat protein
MDVPIFSLYDALHRKLDAIEASWPLQPDRLAWIHEIHRMIYYEWLDMEKRLEQLALFQKYHEESRKHFEKVIGFFDLGMYQEAKERLEEILRHVPDAILVRLLLAAVCYETGDYQRAAHHLTLLLPVVNYAPVIHFAQHLAGCVKAKLGQWEEAKEQFEQLYQADPSREETIFNLALCYHHLGMHKESGYLLRNLIALNPSDPQLKRLCEHIERNGQ